MCHILILDDKKRQAEYLKTTVENFAHVAYADFSTTVNEALKLTELAVQAEKPYTVFLIDHRLGSGKDGIDVMQELKEASPYTSAVILTGYGDDEVGIRAYHAGAFHYLEKPTSPNDYSELEFVLRAVTVHNARRKVELRYKELLEITLEVSEIVGTELDIDKIMMTVLEKLKELFQNTALCVLFYNEDESVLSFAPQTLKYYEIHNPRLQHIRNFPLDKKEKGSIATKIARVTLESGRQEVVHIPDVKKDPDYLPLNPKTTSELCVSLVGGSQLLGILALEREGSIFKKEDIDLVETVARQLSFAIKRAHQSEELAFKSRVATMTAWASDIAHDINREIGQIRGKSYLLKQYSKDKKVLSYADSIEESAAIINSVGPWGNREKAHFVIDDYLQKELSKILKHRSITLELFLQAPNTYVEVNENELIRVLRHLVRNASRAMDEFCREDEKKIFVSSKGIRGKKVEILFEDYGLGIDDDIRQAIFHRKIDSKEDSGGYGLLLVRQLVDDMGGKIVLLPADVNKGAVFSLRLPIVDSKELQGG